MEITIKLISGDEIHVKRGETALEIARSRSSAQGLEVLMLKMSHVVLKPPIFLLRRCKNAEVVSLFLRAECSPHAHLFTS